MKLLTVLFLIANMAVSFCINGVGDIAVKNDAAGFVRLHIRASGDSEEEQALKLRVRDRVLETTTSLLSGVTDKQSALTTVNGKLDMIKEAAEAAIDEYGSGEEISVEVKREYFERREYEGFFLPAGTYDSLIIEIGGGQGHNWWCVIFPAVCLSGSFDGKAESAMSVNISAVPESLRLAESPVPKKVKYELWIVKVIRELFADKD